MKHTRHILGIMRTVARKSISQPFEAVNFHAGE